MVGPPRPRESWPPSRAPVCLVWAGTGPAPEPRPHPGLRGIITFGEVKGSTPHPAWPPGLGTEWEGKLPTLNTTAPSQGYENPGPRPPAQAEAPTPAHFHTCWLSVCQGFCMSVSSTDWLVLRAGPSPPQNPGLVTDIVPLDSGQRAQQVPLPDWPRVSAALSQLSWPNAFSPSWRLMVTGLFLVGTAWRQGTTCDPGGRSFSANADTGGHKGPMCARSPDLAGEWWTLSLPLLAVEDHNCCSRVPACAWNICKDSQQHWEQRVPPRREPGAGVRARLTFTFSEACFTMAHPTFTESKGKTVVSITRLARVSTHPVPALQSALYSSCSFHLSHRH